MRRTICRVAGRDTRVLAPTTGDEGSGRTITPGGWHSVITVPWVWLAGGLAVCALFAGGVNLFSADPLHRLWGLSAAIAYAAAALAVVAFRARATLGVDLALAAAVCGAILFPLLWMVAHGHGEPEVGVVATSANTLIHHGTPYRSTQALANTTNPNQYNPYLPLMAAFGIPQALFGHGLLTDPRVWFGLVFLVVFACALRIARARDSFRWALLLTASPIIAFELCVGGTDVPMVAFMCLGFALLWRTRDSVTPVAAGLALGVASSMKATAWPALVVAFALLYKRDGQRVAWRFTAVALAVVLVIVGPFAALRPGALVKNTILFPLGLASVKSQAASPLLGHALAQTGVVGHTIVVILLIGSGLAIALSLVIRPPADVPAATLRLVIGLSAMFVLAPSTRFGYFIYPAALVLWLLVSQAGRKTLAEYSAPELAASD
jgi:Glycosyltransferase family 87